MAYGGINKWTPPRKAGETPSVSTNQSDLARVWRMSGLRRDGTDDPSRETKFAGANGDRKIFIFPVQLTTGRIDNLTRLIYTLLNVLTIHRYIYIYILP